MQGGKTPYLIIDAKSRGIMVLCKPCEQYSRLVKERNGKESIIKEEKLSEEERKRMAPILKYLNDNTIITCAIGRDLSGKTAITTKRYLNRLCEAGILKQKGAGRGAYYERK